MLNIESGKKYIVRCNDAGVFYGEIADVDGSTVHMKNVRKLWYWEGANTVENLAVDGTSRPEQCRFTVVVADMVVLNAIQIIPCTEKAKKSIDGVEEWIR